MAEFVGGGGGFIKGLFIVHRFCTQPQIFCFRYFTDLDRKNADFRLCDPQISKIFGYLLVGNTRRVIPKSFKFDDPRLSRASTSRQFQIFHSVESWDN
ncbi:unnamed protein product [Meloidogyne enterolobii]|uniref:Uncharacterized protein n=1 Tax=Meloidogyne enterolobii TaxID=390850 RepID=A0ACB0YU54_MELEN